MAHLLLPFVSHLELFCFLFQMFTAIFLIMGLQKLALRFIANRYVAWFSILVALIPLNDFGLGNVEVYSECLQASAVACAFVIWALHFFLGRKYLLVSLTMATATIIQVLDGLDVMLVLSVVAFIGVIKRETTWRDLLKLILPFSLTAGVWLLSILYGKSGAANIAPKEYFEILFEFRHPHHFIFATFSKAKILVYITLTCFALFYFSQRSKQLFRFVLVSTTGLVFYIVSTDVFQVEFIANFQFYKVTQWVKFMGVLAAVGFLFSHLPKLTVSFTTQRLLLFMGALLVVTVTIFFRSHLPYSVPFQVAVFKLMDDKIEIAEQIRGLTPLEAVFIQPFDNTELKFYSQRSSYVEFKANVRHRAYVGEWYKRISEVYGVSYKDKLKGFELSQHANLYFNKLSAQQLKELKQKGVTHMLTTRNQPPAIGKLVAANTTYAVYKL